MLFRLLFLLTLLGFSAEPDYREEEERLGGQGFGGIVIAFVAIGALVLIGLIVLAIMALMGNFEIDTLRPTT